LNPILYGREKESSQRYIIFTCHHFDGEAVYITWLPPLVSAPADTKNGYGLFENRQVMEITSDNGRKTFLVVDSAGNFIFNIPLKNCLIDSRYREGKLRFRDL